MFSRKLTIRSDHSKIDELIFSLQTDTYDPEGLEAQLLTQSESLRFYFNNLHQQINSRNLLSVRKYESLNDGLYVLLKGQISFMYMGNCELERDLMKCTKTSTFKGMSGSSLISQPFNVFECTLKNCTCLQDCFLLKIQEEQAVNAKFYEYYNQRIDLCEHQYLDHNHQQLFKTEESTNVFTVDTRIHSNFVYKTFSFRQSVSLNSVGVIWDGKAKLRDKRFGSSEMERYCVLVPTLTYEVTSACLEVMYIIPNETLNLKLNLLHLKEEDKKLPGLSKQNRHFCKQNMSNSAATFENIFSKNDREKREKEITKLSKESEHYSIISSFLCKKNLNFVKKQSANNKHRENRDNRFKNPLVLFNIVNQKSRLATPNFISNNTTPSLQERRTQPARSQKKSTTTFGGSPNLNLLRKLRLPLKDYEKMVERQKTANIRTDVKAKSLFTLTADKHLRADQDSEDEQFQRYNEP